MRVLLIAPDHPDINTLSEIRDLTGNPIHRVTVLNGPVTPQIVAEYARRGYNAIHFAGHSTSDYVELSNGTKLQADDIARIARDAHADLVLFNSCDAGPLAAYAVEHGDSYAIASTRKLDDGQAWEFPGSFYAALANGSWRDILRAYQQASSQDGRYALNVAPALIVDCNQQVAELRAKLLDGVVIQPRVLIFVTSLVMIALFVLWLILLGLSGRGIL